MKFWSNQYLELFKNKINDPKLRIAFIEITRACLPQDYLENNPDIVSEFAQVLNGFLKNNCNIHGDVFKLLTCYLEKAYNTEAGGDIQKLLENPKLKSCIQIYKSDMLFILLIQLSTQCGTTLQK